MELLERTQYINQLDAWRDKQVVKVITGRLFGLLRLAVSGGGEVDASLFSGMSDGDWRALLDDAARHGVSAILFQAFEKGGVKPPLDALMAWVGQVDYVKSFYSEHKRRMCEVATLCDEAGADMLVMKGLALAEMYPVPEAREFGDLDIFTMPREGDMKILYAQVHSAVNSLLTRKGFKVEHHEKDDVFHYESMMVEHHRFFFDRCCGDADRINDRLVEIIKRDRGNNISGNIYYPSPDFNAVFLLIHTIHHMSFEGALLKNVVDWGMFLLREGDKVHWDEIIPFLRDVRWSLGFDVLTRVTEMVLDVDFSRFFIDKPDEVLSCRVLEAILDTTLHQEADYHLMKRVVMKTGRLFSRRWLYSNSSGLIPASFWRDCVWLSVKSHIARPEQF